MGIVIKFETALKRKADQNLIKAVSTDSLVMAAQYPGFLDYSEDLILTELQTRFTSPEAKLIIQQIKKGQV